MDDASAPTATPPRSALLKLYDSNRPAAALLTLLVLEIVPILGLISSAREGWDAWTTPAVGLAVAALIGPAGILLGRAWGVIATSYVSWAGIVLVVLQAMTLGLTPLRLAPAAAYAAVLATLSSLSRNEDAGRAKGGAPADLPVGAWFKENIEAIIVAFIMALVIRCFGIEVFKIPSSSMEPTLLGDVSDRHSVNGCAFPNVHVTRGGDRIMVTKFFYAATDIQRYDVVVFKFPLNQSRNFIKRVVGLPDEELLIYHGNIFARKPDEKEFSITRRPPRTQDALWIDPDGLKTYLDGPDTFKKYWEAEGPEPAVANGEIGYLAPPPGAGAKIRYKEAPRDPDNQDVSDLRIAFEATLTSAQGEIFAEILNAYGRFELRLFADRDGELRRFPTHDDKAAHAAVSMPVRRRLELDQRVRVELGVYDGLAYARVDGEEPRIEFIKTREKMDPLLTGAPSLRFGGAGGAFRVRNLKVGRDVHHKRSRSTARFDDDKPVRIKPGHYVMMGDNVTSSHDSRGWMQQGYTLVDRQDVVEYEGQQEFEPDVTPLSIRDRYGLKVTPTEIIADKYGRVWALYAKGTDPGPLPAEVPAGRIDKTLDPIDFYEIGEQYIVGKALWVWWPPGRWFKLIR